MYVYARTCIPKLPQNDCTLPMDFGRFQSIPHWSPSRATVGTGMKGARCALNATGPPPRPPPAVGRRERLVEVHVDDVEAEVPGAREAEQGVEIGAVHVDLNALGMAEPRRFQDARFEQAERVGHGDHQRGDILVEEPLEV